jgi:molecular chaperone GrpE (heat shock protein)
MRKKLIILGLVLFLIGTSALIWVLTAKRKERRLAASYRLKYASETNDYLRQYSEWAKLAPEERARLPWGLDNYKQAGKESQSRREQQERLKADMDKLAAGKTDVHPFADVLYGENWQEELRRYKTQNKLKEFILTGSTMCMVAGGAILAGYLLFWTVRLLTQGLDYLKQFSTAVFRQIKEAKYMLLAGADAKINGIASRTLIKSGWQTFNKNDASRNEPPPAQTAFSTKSEPCPDDSPQDAQRIAVLLSDEESVEFENAPNTERGVSKPCNTPVGVRQVAAPDDASQNGNPVKNIQETALLDSPDENSLKSIDVRQFARTDDALEDSLETQTEDFEKQVQEIKQMAQKVQQAAVEHSGPINNTLSELTEQVAAIREYASNQQDRVKKLQEGYDWNIIKTFCLRVIRCIDNLESRIGRLSKQSVKTPNLEEIRDELVFALESSGVERFEPEINSDYRGQEKMAEAIKEKEHCDDPNLTGKIAKVVRPGYQYCIDEENVKVVRTAQVKLFG